MSRVCQAILAVSIPLVLGCASTNARGENTKMSGPTKRPDVPLICLWQHQMNVDIAPLVKELVLLR